MSDQHTDILLSCHGVTRSFSMPATATAPARELTVLNALNLEVRRGEMVSIVGQVEQVSPHCFTLWGP